MYYAKWLAIILLTCAGIGCTASNGRSYESAAWRAGNPLGKVLVIVPKYAGGGSDDQPKRDQEIRDGVREALARTPGTTVIYEPAQNAGAPGNTAPVSDSQAIADARKLEAQSICIVTVGQFGGRFAITLLPPGWELRSTVQYSLRLIDVKSGNVLLDSVRERTTGGYLALTNPAVYPTDLKNDVGCVLAKADSTADDTDGRR